MTTPPTPDVLVGYGPGFPEDQGAPMTVERATQVLMSLGWTADDIMGAFPLGAGGDAALIAAAQAKQPAPGGTSQTAVWAQNTDTGETRYMSGAELQERSAAGEPWVPYSKPSTGGDGGPTEPFTSVRNEAGNLYSFNQVTGQYELQVPGGGGPGVATHSSLTQDPNTGQWWGVNDQTGVWEVIPGGPGLPGGQAAGRTTLTAIPYPDGTMHTVLLNVDTGDVVKDYGSATPSGTPYEMAQQIIRKHAGSPEAKAPGAIVDEIQKAVDAAYGPGASAQTIFARGPTEAGGMYNPAAAQAIGQQQGTTNLGVGMLGPLAAGSVSGNIVMGGDVSRYTGTPEQQEAVMTAAGQRPFQTRLSPYGELITTLNLAEAAGRGVAAGTLPATSGLGAAVTATPPLRTAMAPAPLPTGGSIGQLTRAVNQPTAGAAAPSAGGPIGAAARAVNQPPSLGIGGLQRAYRPRRRPGEGVFASLAAAGRTIGQFG